MAVGFSDGVGWCRMLSGWCRVLSGLEVSGRCQGLSGLSVCEDAYALARAVGAVGQGHTWCCTVHPDAMMHLSAGAHGRSRTVVQGAIRCITTVIRTKVQVHTGGGAPWCTVHHGAWRC